MDEFDIQRRILAIVAVLVLLAFFSLSVLVIFPWILRYNSPGSAPIQAGIAVSVLMVIHLLGLLRISFWIKLTRRKHHINRGINTALGIIFIILAFMILDGAIAAMEDYLMASIGMFVCVFCDIAAALVSFSALFFLKPEKRD